MTEEPEPTPQPSLLEVLNGGVGGDAQFAALKTVVEQHIDATFGMFRVVGAGRVGSMSGLNEQFIFVQQ